MSKKYVITQEMVRNLKTVIKKYKKTNAYRKLQFIMLVGNGMSVTKAAETTMYNAKWGYELIKKFCTQQLQEFVKDRRGGARRRNLSPEQEKTVFENCSKKASSGQIITVLEIKKEYEKQSGKTVASSTVYSFLKKHKWRRIMPRGKHPKKANEEAIEASKKLTLNYKI